MPLATVQDFITRARVLLQDATSPYRYSDAEIVEALNLAVSEAARIRPELFLASLRTGQSLPSYSTGALSATVAVDQRYRTPFLYYIVGHVQLRDDEATQDSRAAALLNKFVSQLLTTPS